MPFHYLIDVASGNPLTAETADHHGIKGGVS
jgi:hypothetical protein